MIRSITAFAIVCVFTAAAQANPAVLASSGCVERVCTQWIWGTTGGERVEYCERYEIRIKPQCYVKPAPNGINLPVPRHFTLTPGAMH